MSRIILGTANFGCAYNNSFVDVKEAKKIRDVCKKYDIDTVDTSPYYGDSELIVSEVFKDFKIITKVDPHVKSNLTVKPRCVLLHHFEWFHAFSRIEEDYLPYPNIELGVSVYKGYEVETIIKSKSSAKIVQLPYNLHHNSMDNFFYDLKQNYKVIHARSVFDKGHVLDKERAFNYVYKNPFVDGVVVGVNNAEHLKTIVGWVK